MPVDDTALSTPPIEAGNLVHISPWTPTRHTIWRPWASHLIARPREATIRELQMTISGLTG